MVKVREFCCGCSLRTGTLILAWSVLILNCLFFTVNLKAFLIQKNNLNTDAMSIAFHFIFKMVEPIIGIIVSVLAIWAIQKNKAKYLNGLFWYFCYLTIALILGGIVMMFKPSWEREMAEDELFRQTGLLSSDFKILSLAVFVIVAAFVAYFALVVKSSRDYALRNEARGDFERPDPTIIGYVNKI